MMLEWDKMTGAVACFGIGVCIFVVLLVFSRWWLASHIQGPLEWIWKKLTWLNTPRT